MGLNEVEIAKAIVKIHLLAAKDWLKSAYVDYRSDYYTGDFQDKVYYNYLKEIEDQVMILSEDFMDDIIEGFNKRCEEIK